jgi:hypothetical protein
MRVTPAPLTGCRLQRSNQLARIEADGCGDVEELKQV